MTSKVYRLLMGMLCLVLWPDVIAAYGDWRIGQAQERLKAAGFDRGYIDGVLGSRTRNALRLTFLTQIVDVYAAAQAWLLWLPRARAPTARTSQPLLERCTPRDSRSCTAHPGGGKASLTLVEH
jgi:hypothetical protein